MATSPHSHASSGPGKAPRRKAPTVRPAPAGALPRVVLYAGRLAEGERVDRLLDGAGYDVVLCSDGEALLEAVVERRTDVVVFEIMEQSVADLGLLQLLRRAVPAVPLILVAQSGSLEIQRVVQQVRPSYYTVVPVDAAELCEAVRSVLERRTRP